MPVSAKIADFMERSSWIRKMFEEGARLKQQFGPQNVFDFSLGNPNLEPSVGLKKAISMAANDNTPGAHAYMPNAGLMQTRDAIAQKISRDEGIQIDGSTIIMTVGAGGGLNVALKTLLNPGDEVVIPKPFFVEYVFYCDNHGGSAVLVPTRPDFSLDVSEIEKAITPKTAAVLINSPNNPTGRIYTEEQVKALSDVLRSKSSEFGRAIVLISDEPYRGIIYDSAVVPSILKAYKNSMVVTSFSKDLSIPGERLGYIAMNPEMESAEKTAAGLVLANRILGFVNAPSLIQRAVANHLNDIVDVSIYKRRRDRLYNALTAFGYDVIKPEGAFYLFPKSPIEDDVAFVARLRDKLILTVPGVGFGGPGFFRIAYCVSDETIEGSMKGFEEAIKGI